jgi:hypothetical protein
MSDGPVAGVTLLARLGSLPRPPMWYRLRPLSLHFRCPKPVPKLDLGTGTYISVKHHSWYLAKEYSVPPRGNAEKCNIISAGLCHELFTDQIKLLEDHDRSAASNYI